MISSFIYSHIPRNTASAISLSIILNRFRRSDKSNSHPIREVEAVTPIFPWRVELLVIVSVPVSVLDSVFELVPEAVSVPLPVLEVVSGCPE